MTNTENSINKTTSMKQHDRCSFTLNEKEESPPSYTGNESHLKRNTPILFSTNRGLHLRMANTTRTLTPHQASVTSTESAINSKINSNYTMVFCDLERWSTNRANTINLEDTFTMAKSSIATGSRASNSSKFLPHMPTSSVRFNGYSRFDVD